MPDWFEMKEDSLKHLRQFGVSYNSSVYRPFFYKNNNDRVFISMAWFLDLYANYYSPCKERIEKLFSNVHPNNLDQKSEASILFKLDSLHNRKHNGGKQKKIKGTCKDLGLSEDFYLIRNSIAHSSYCFIDSKTIRFGSISEKDDYVDIIWSDFVEYPRVLYIKTRIINLLYELMYQSIIIDFFKSYV